MWRLAGEHLVEHRRERVDVAARVDRAVAGRLLGAHVLWRAERYPRLRQARARGGAERERDPEIGDHGLPVLEQDVLRLDVAVDHAVPVGIVQRARDGARDLDGRRHRELPLARQPLAQRLSLDVRHDIIDETAGLAGVEERQDVRVVQVRGDPNLAEEPLDAQQGGEVWSQHLQRDVAVVLQVARDIDRGHPADASLALYRVLFSERGRELREGVSHCARTYDATSRSAIGRLPLEPSGSLVTPSWRSSTRVPPPPLPREVNMHILFPALLRFSDVGLLLLRLMVALVFLDSGWNHVTHPVERSKSIGASPGFTVFLGTAEVLGGVGVALGVLTQLAAIGLILIMLGAIQKKIFVWKIGFWGERTYGWHYDSMLVVMNIVIITSGGGRFVLL